MPPSTTTGGRWRHQNNYDGPRTAVFVRPQRECKAMSRIARRGIQSTNNRCMIKNCVLLFCRTTTVTNTDGGGGEKERNEEPDNDYQQHDSDDDPKRPPMQYTLLSNHHHHRNHHRRANTQTSVLPFPIFRQKQLCFLCSSGAGNTAFFGDDVDKRISKFLSFTFRSSYFILFLVFAMCYYGLVLTFALIYQGISSRHPECISSGGKMIGSGEGASIFADCFQLSWQTFSTVGLGAIYPSSGASPYDVPTVCLVVGFLGSFEAYLGVLFAGMTAAILFRKVLRSQNVAQALFSDPIVVRFGKKELEGGHHGENVTKSTNDTMKNNGVSPKQVNDEEVGERLSSIAEMSVMDEIANESQCIPCPSLEFRVVNLLHHIQAGEIVEATLDCVAILDPRSMDFFSSDVDQACTPSKRSPRVKQRSMPNMHFSTTDLPTNRSHGVKQRSSLADFANAIRDANKKEERDAFHESDSKTPNVFTSISLEANTHPYFNRTWYGRHRLDENSPLLTPAVRNRIKNTGGYWPSDLNNYESIKRSLRFRHILVCISGTSNATAATVYAQKVYDLVDVNVGYRFVPMNYHADDGSLRTDEYLLNAVCEQRGGGAEPFQ